jgi:RimJ/RimL family protein N-acetyltransferase
MIHRPYWRQGFAHEAAASVRDYAFYQLDRSRVISLVRPVNIPSQRTALSLGMKPEKLTIHADLEHIVFALRRL